MILRLESTDGWRKVTMRMIASGSRRLKCDEISQLTWRKRLEELICGGGNNFVFNAFLHIEPMHRFEKIAGIGERSRIENF